MAKLKKERKKVSNLWRGKMPLCCHFALYFISYTQISGKFFSVNSRKSAQCMFYIRLLYLCWTTEGDYNTWTKTHHAAGRMKFRKGQRDVLDVVDKKECFLLCFVQNIQYLVGTSDVTTISNNWGNILQILCKTSLKEKRVLLCSANAWTGWFRSDAVIFRLFKVFSSSLQHIQRTYWANIRNHLIENTTIVSVGVILSVLNDVFRVQISDCYSMCLQFVCKQSEKNHSVHGCLFLAVIFRHFFQCVMTVSWNQLHTGCWNYLYYIFIHSCKYTTFQIKTVFNNILFSTEVQPLACTPFGAKSDIYKISV